MSGELSPAPCSGGKNGVATGAKAVRNTKGILPMAAMAWKNDFERIMVPAHYTLDAFPGCCVDG